MSDELIIREEGEGIVTLTLNRPETRNPISDPEMIEELVRLIEDADGGMACRAIILTGAGSAFSSGGNIASMKAEEGLAGKVPAQTRRNYRRGIQRLPLLFESIEVPVIAAVNGPAIGAGCDLACMCDIRIASDRAKFAESFVKLGLVAGDGGAWLLPRVVGFARASEMALTGETIDAQTALAAGLVSRVTAPEDLMTQARAIAKNVAGNPPHAVRITKRLLREARLSTLSASLEMSAAAQALCHETQEHKDAVDGFLAKSARSSKDR